MTAMSTFDFDTSSFPSLNHLKVKGWLPEEMEQVTVTIEPAAFLEGNENGLILGGSKLNEQD